MRDIISETKTEQQPCSVPAGAETLAERSRVMRLPVSPAVERRRFMLNAGAGVAAALGAGALTRMPEAKAAGEVAPSYRAGGQSTPVGIAHARP